jgi:hypothetical protein
LAVDHRLPDETGSVGSLEWLPRLTNPACQWHTTSGTLSFC